MQLNIVITTGLVFPTECPIHSANIILHSGKKIFGKHFIGKRFFVEYFFGYSKDFTDCRKALRKLRIVKHKKISKTNFKLWEQLSLTSHYHTHRHIIFIIIFNQPNLHILWIVRFQLVTSLSRIPYSTTTLLHQLCLYYVFLFLIYYNKPWVIWLF
jgi:hypothetical protein